MADKFPELTLDYILELRKKRSCHKRGKKYEKTNYKELNEQIKMKEKEITEKEVARQNEEEANYICSNIKIEKEESDEEIFSCKTQLLNDDYSTACSMESSVKTEDEDIFARIRSIKTEKEESDEEIYSCKTPSFVKTENQDDFIYTKIPELITKDSASCGLFIKTEKEDDYGVSTNIPETNNNNDYTTNNSEYSFGSTETDSRTIPESNYSSNNSLSFIKEEEEDSDEEIFTQRTKVLICNKNILNKM